MPFLLYKSRGVWYNIYIRNGQRVTKNGGAYDHPCAMVNYSDVKHGNILSLSFVTINEDGDFVISVSASMHVIFGGHASVGFNITEFFERLFD